jgi:hypothetical protein
MNIFAEHAVSEDDVPVVRQKKKPTGLGGLGFGVTKRKNASYKAKNHAKNQEIRAQMNQSADGSEGKNPRPGGFKSPPAPHEYRGSTHPRRKGFKK